MPLFIEQIHATASLLVPEILLLATVCIMFLAGPFLVSHAGDAPAGLRHQWGFLSLAALGLAWAMWFGGSRGTFEGALFRIDELVWYTRGLSFSAGIVLVLVLWNQIDDAHAAEAHACLLSILVGTNLVAASFDLVSMFLALELVSIPTYVLLYLPRRDQAGRESTIKYFLLSVFSSAIVLYGMSWLFGFAGSTNFDVIAAAVTDSGPEQRMLQFAVAFLIAGLSFRIAAVPFHFYAPDVFQGTTASNAALLSFIPKLVGFVALLRLLPLAGGSLSMDRWLPSDSLQVLIAVLAVVTMFLGNLMALRQANLYRLMAYSSIAHAGYMLVGLAIGEAGAVGGIQSLQFYLAAYALMTIGVFALLAAVEHPDHSLRTDADLRGLNRQHPAVSVLLAICLFSLTGLPPTAGFLGKLNLFLAAWSDASDLGRTLAILLALNAAIAAWYYLRLIAVMFLEPAIETEPKSRGLNWSSFIAGAACSILSIALFLAPQWLWNNLSL